MRKPDWYRVWTKSGSRAIAHLPGASNIMPLSNDVPKRSINSLAMPHIRGYWCFRVVSFILFAHTIFPLGAQVPTTRPKITGISYVRFKATDFDRSRAFYEKILGLTYLPDGCEGGSHPCFVINPRQHVELIQAKAGDNGSFLGEVGFATSDVKQMQEYLQARGVKTSQISRRGDRTLFFEVEDPEHNHIGFVESSDVAEGRTRELKDARNKTVRNKVGNQLLHAGFVVKDLELMKKFYLELLGFRLYWYGGFKDDGVDWYEIQVPDGNNWVEFMLNISPTADRQELGVQNHFSLGVIDATAAAAKLRANGAIKFDGPEIGRDGKNSLDIYDPDLSRVEVMELTPSQVPCCHAYTAPHPKL